MAELAYIDTCTNIMPIAKFSEVTMWQKYSQLINTTFLKEITVSDKMGSFNTCLCLQ